MITDQMKQLEPWPGYFQLRTEEVRVLLRFWEPKEIENFLEIGCGLGFVSSIFSNVARKVYATDLIRTDTKTNTPGMDRTVRFLNTQNRKNVFFFGADALSLPVRSNSMDVVFSMSLFEHIALDKRDSALGEMKRVLKKNGVIVAIVPTAIERIGSFFNYYADLAVRAAKRISAKDVHIGKKSAGYSHKQHAIGISKLLPPIHGFYNSRFEELCNQFPMKWERLFARNGLDIVRTFTIRFLPFSTRAFIALYALTNRIDAFFGDKVPCKYLGKNYCIVAKKNEDGKQ